MTFTLPATLTFTPYPTLTPSITPFGGDRTSTPAATGCVVPEGWRPYFVQRGDTLYGLAARFGLDLATLADANCIADVRNITVGQIVFAPPGILTAPPPAVTPQPLPLGGYTQFNCNNPTATITDPRPGAVLRGTVAIFGTASHTNFDFYRLQISGSAEPENFATLFTMPWQVMSGELGALNTLAFAPGDYWLRLTVVDNTGNYPPECTVRVRIER
jgi:LysM repeat protein